MRGVAEAFRAFFWRVAPSAWCGELPVGEEVPDGVRVSIRVTLAGWEFEGDGYYHPPVRGRVGEGCPERQGLGSFVLRFGEDTYEPLGGHPEGAGRGISGVEGEEDLLAREDAETDLNDLLN